LSFIKKDLSACQTGDDRVPTIPLVTR